METAIDITELIKRVDVDKESYLDIVTLSTKYRPGTKRYVLKVTDTDIFPWLSRIHSDEKIRSYTIGNETFQGVVESIHKPDNDFEVTIIRL